MLSLIISVIWVCMSISGLVLKAFCLQSVKKEVDKATTKIEDIRATYRAGQAGKKAFICLNIIGVTVLIACFMLGFIKVWVVVVDAIAFVIAVILNILFLGYLRKKSQLQKAA